MDDFLKEVKEQIFAEVPEIKTIRLWNNQVEELLVSKNEAISFPAVFMGFDSELNYTSKTVKGLQYAEKVEFYVHIAIENYVDNDNDDSTEWYILDLKQKIYKALEQFSGVSFGHLNRVREVVNQNHDEVNQYTQIYIIPILVDTSNLPESTPVEATLDLKVNLKMDNVVVRTSRG
jgi:hypothetical protein